MANLNLPIALSDRIHRNAIGFSNQACCNALSLMQKKNCVSYQIIELENSGLPLQGILPIRAQMDQV